MLDGVETTNREIRIPFDGFYYSIHDSKLDDGLASIFQDDSGEVATALLEKAQGDIDWQRVRLAYVQGYAKEFKEATGLESLAFAQMESPREYNFETDSLFCTLSESDIARMHKETPADILAKVAQERHSHRSGFVSFYSATVADWGPLGLWDHNQLATLLLAWLESDPAGADYSADDWQLYSMDDYSGNGYFDNWICDAMGETAKAAMNLAYYMRQRIERGDKAAQAHFHPHF